LPLVDLRSVQLQALGELSDFLGRPSGVVQELALHDAFLLARQSRSAYSCIRMTSPITGVAF